MEYRQYLEKVLNRLADPKTNGHLRMGQIYFIVLDEARPDLTNKVRGRYQDIDPFYFDANIDKFKDFIQENW